MTPAVRKILENVPFGKCFRVGDIVHDTHPNSIHYDSEGRIMNRGSSAVSRILNKTRGIIRVNGTYWASDIMIESQLNSNIWSYKGQ